MGVHGKSNRIRKAVPESDTLSESTISIAQNLQQRCLNIFKDALWASSDDLASLQEVKGHLYNREFARAFGRPEYLRVYALRWSASRALAYAAIFHTIQEHLGSDSNGTRLRVTCLGGGAGAEVVGLAVLLALQSPEADLRVAVHTVDVADWADVLAQVSQAVIAPPKLSPYASAAVKERNQALLLAERFATQFSRADVLAWDLTAVRSAAASVQLVTIMFTLNELYTSSVVKTQRLLGMLTEVMDSGALLLVVDSPGSYSTVSIKDADKKYPMRWLLDSALLASRKDSEGEVNWIKLLSQESQWYRLPGGLQYPVDLEDMRCQIHLYKRQSR